MNISICYRDRFKKQHNIIINALRNKRIGNINMPCVSSLTEEDILLLTMSKLNRKENE